MQEFHALQINFQHKRDKISNNLVIYIPNFVISEFVIREFDYYLESLTII